MRLQLPVVLLVVALVVLVFSLDFDSKPEPAPTTAPPAPLAQRPQSAPTSEPRADELIALRRYEQLINGRRAAIYEVRWLITDQDGARVLLDTTEIHSKSVRMMGRVRDIFESRTVSKTLRTERGELISQETTVRMPSRTDRERVVRTKSGYEVTVWTGENREVFAVATDGPAHVDAEAFLGSRIRAGEAVAGAKFTLRLLSTARKRIIEPTLRVIGPDPEGPGLKVVESFEGNDFLWWFDRDGAVVRGRSGIMTIRRDDELRLDDLPARPAAWRITLPSNVDMPRIFTARNMLVDILVDTDETTRPPRIPKNPFTEVVESADDRVRLRLKSHDDAGATVPLPIAPDGLEEHLKATRLMEVDDPAVRRLARRIVGDEKDARAAAVRIADYVFRFLRKGSPDIGQPTVKQIMRNPIGDCSEHALLFTGLCRAAGIPARRCSGYVCIGDDWGGHAWCEIWLGKWVGADPTTNEIGTRARYIFLSRPDDPEVRPGTITPERTEIWIRRAEYDDGVLDFENGKTDDIVYSGIRLAKLPRGWKVSRNGASVAVNGPGVRVNAWLRPDHGYRNLDRLRRQMPGARRKSFGTRDAVVARYGNSSMWIVPLGRENLRLRVTKFGSAQLSDEKLAALFAPTLKATENPKDDG